MPDVLDGVVQVDVEIALRVDREVEARVLAELLEHVVEERDAGRDRRRARAVDDERDVDRRLLRLPAQRRCRGVIDATSARTAPARRGTRRSRRAYRP